MVWYNIKQWKSKISFRLSTHKRHTISRPHWRTTEWIWWVFWRIFLMRPQCISTENITYLLTFPWRSSVVSGADNDTSVHSGLTSGRRGNPPAPSSGPWYRRRDTPPRSWPWHFSEACRKKDRKNLLSNPLIISSKWYSISKYTTWCFFCRKKGTDYFILVFFSSATNRTFQTNL